MPDHGGVVVVANHISNADPLALGQFLAYSGRWPRFLAKSSLFHVPGLGRLLRGAHQIPVERGGSRAVDALAAARTALAAGQVVVVYPEGTWYSGMTTERIPLFVREHLVEGRPIAEWVFASNPLPHPEGEPEES